MGRERPRQILHPWAGRGRELPAEDGHGSGGPRAPSRRGRLRVLRQAPVDYHLQRAELLRRVRQCGRDDEYRRDTDVQLQSAQAGEGKEVSMAIASLALCPGSGSHLSGNSVLCFQKSIYFVVAIFYF